MLQKLERNDKVNKEAFMLAVLRDADKIEQRKQKEEVTKKLSYIVIYLFPYVNVFSPSESSQFNP